MFFLLFSQADFVLAVAIRDGFGDLTGCTTLAEFIREGKFTEGAVGVVIRFIKGDGR